MKIKAVTFNMQNGQLWKEEEPDCPEQDFAASVEFLKSLQADVYFLQEVERGYDGGKQVYPPPNYGLLKEGFPDFDSAFVYPPVNPDELPFGLGLAILSRWPLTAVGEHRLPAGELEFEFDGRKRRPSQRSILRANTVVDGHTIQLVNTHLQAYFMVGSSSLEHPEQRGCLESLLRGLGETALLGGDFNSAPGEALDEQMEGSGFRSAQTAEVTWKRRPYVVDHIFYGEFYRLEECEVVATNTSDHHAVKAIFSIGE